VGTKTPGMSGDVIKAILNRILKKNSTYYLKIYFNLKLLFYILQMLFQCLLLQSQLHLFLVILYLRIIHLFNYILNLLQR
jgi:hypothetical protein